MISRIIDANLNRLTEALRVIEEYYRFLMNDADTSDRLYRLRHEVGGIARELGTISSRNTESDSGKSRFDTEAKDLRSVVSANMKRAQEASRVLEEYSKIDSPSLSPFWQRLRFEIYGLESKLNVESLVRGSLYLIITPKYCLEDPVKTAEKACAAGIDILQLRDKESDDRKVLETAREMRKITRDSVTTFIINNRFDIALSCEADGVHLGQTDLRVEDARKCLGGGKIIGLSTHNCSQLLKVASTDADYLALGPVYSTDHKEKKEKLVGTGGVEKAAGLNISKPLFLIGGLEAENITPLCRLGFSRMVFMTGICMKEDIAGEINKIRKVIKSHES